MAAERKTGARNSMQVVGTFSSHPCHVARLRPLFADDQSAAVKLNQIGTMAYADYRASRQTFLQHAIQIAFGAGGKLRPLHRQVRAAAMEWQF